MFDALNRTHAFECEGFADEFRALVDRVLPETTAAVVHVDEDELRTGPDGDACRRTWDAVRHRLERVPDEDRNGTAAWRCPTAAEPGREALFDLVALADGVAGSHFVSRIELRRDGTAVLGAVPHHADAAVDATLLGEAIRPGEIVGLPGESACLVPTGTRLEWVAGDRRWRVAGGSLCVETLDGRRTSCYGLTNLRRATTAGDGTVLVLDWDPGDLPDDAIGTILSWVADLLYAPPETVPCETPDRARAVRAYLRELLDAYDGRRI